VLATTHFDDPAILAEVSTGLGPGMKGEGNLGKAAGKEMTADRGY
jgi:pyridoxal 5'-phosphate synthase pdxS subunit